MEPNITKKIIIAAIGVVSLIAGIITGVIHKNSKKYGKVVKEVDDKNV